MSQKGGARVGAENSERQLQRESSTGWKKVEKVSAKDSLTRGLKQVSGEGRGQ